MASALTNLAIFSRRPNPSSRRGDRAVTGANVNPVNSGDMAGRRLRESLSACVARVVAQTDLAGLWGLT